MLNLRPLAALSVFVALIGAPAGPAHADLYDTLYEKGIITKKDWVKAKAEREKLEALQQKMSRLPLPANKPNSDHDDTLDALYEKEVIAKEDWLKAKAGRVKQEASQQTTSSPPTPADKPDSGPPPPTDRDDALYEKGIISKEAWIKAKAEREKREAWQQKLSLLPILSDRFNVGLNVLDALAMFHPMHAESWCGWPMDD